MIIRGNSNTSGTSYSGDVINYNINKGQEEDKRDKYKATGQSYALDVSDNQNPIFMRQNQLKKGAMKIVMDAFAGEQKIDNRIENHEDKVRELTKEANASSREIKRLQELRDSLKNNLGIEGDSQEQNDFELLKKDYEISKRVSNELLTREEAERLKAMEPMTEYQEAALEYVKMEVEFKRRMSSANNAIENENRTIEAIKQARVQIHPIVDAKKESDKIIEAANREVSQKLLDEAKENVDENIEEDEEKAQEAKEKKEEKQEKINKDLIRNDTNGKTEMEGHDKLKSAAQVHELNIDWNNAHKKMKKLLKAQKLLAEDIKGLEVNAEL